MSPVEATPPRRSVAVLWIMAASWLVLFGPSILLPQSTGGRLVVVTGILLIGAAFWLGLRTATLRVVADDQGVRGKKFLGGSVRFAWGEVTAVRERSPFDPAHNRRWEEVELVAGKRSVTIADDMTGFAELRTLIDRQVPSTVARTAEDDGSERARGLWLVGAVTLLILTGLVVIAIGIGELWLRAA